MGRQRKTAIAVNTSAPAKNCTNGSVGPENDHRIAFQGPQAIGYRDETAAKQTGMSATATRSFRPRTKMARAGPRRPVIPLRILFAPQSHFPSSYIATSSMRTGAAA